MTYVRINGSIEVNGIAVSIKTSFETGEMSVEDISCAVAKQIKTTLLYGLPAGGFKTLADVTVNKSASKRVKGENNGSTEIERAESDKTESIEKVKPCGC